MKRYANILLVFLSLMFSAQDILQAQESAQSQREKFRRRLSVGGNLGFQFGSVAGIVISPELKMRVVDQLYVGVGFTYEYNHLKNYYYDSQTNDYYNLNLNIFGGRIFARYYLASIFNNFLGNIFAHVEYEYLTYSRPYIFDPNGHIIDPYLNTFSPGKQMIEINSLFVGGGYKQPVSDKAFLDLMVLFNLNDTYYSPYSNPIVRLGFGYQF